MTNYLDELNDVQRQAVEQTTGASLVIAGAGSGKTRVLTYRIVHLLNQGVRPSNILSLTFTNKAAREMKERIASIVGEETARYIWMGTFHSIFAKILRIEAEAIGYASNFTIYDADDSKNLIKNIIKEFKLDDQAYKPNVVFSRISQAKNNLVTAQAYAANPRLVQIDKSTKTPEIHQIYKTYAQRCFQSGVMDFDDLLLQTNILFRNKPEILKKYQDKFKFILVDEYQDTNSSQYLIIRKLSETNQNICVVGDDAQSIYSFRGAKIENILNYQKDYPNCHVFKLEQNYRSTQNIVDAANSIIAKNKHQIQKHVFSENSKGKRIKVIQAVTDVEEGYKVSNDIIEKHLGNHYDFKDFVILYRTNAQSRIFEESLRKRNIPYKIYGGLSFYQRKEIKDLLAYFRFIVNQRDSEALKRIINYPKRGIGVASVGKIEQAARMAETSMWEVITNLASFNLGFTARTINPLREFVGLILSLIREQEQNNAYEMASMIASKSGILKGLYSDTTPEGVSRYENVQELLNGIKEFNSQAESRDEIATLSLYMEDVALLTSDDKNDKTDNNRVALMTIHSAKGLEFKNVYIVGVEENLFPSLRSVGSQSEIEEERRLFYVAVTRAEEHLSISFAKSRYKWGQLYDCAPSRFITEIDELYVDLPENESFEEQKETPSYSFNKRPAANKKTNLSSRRVINTQRAQKTNPAAASNFTSDDPNKLEIGMNIEHQRFGKGFVEDLQGEFPNKKATIVFEKEGTKLLLLKFAKLKILKEHK